MKVELHKIKIRDLVADYQDSAENGVKGYHGKLDIRPKYQREFVYKEAQRNAVIDTVIKGFPLNVMYWVKNAEDDFEVLDGQQRTISICQFIQGDFSVDYRYFHNFTDTEKAQVLDYELMVYFCEGDDKEKLDWFEIINIAGEKLTKQELRNAVYASEWLSDAKRYFSKTGGAAYSIGNKYLKGVAIRQEYLETALRWIANKESLKTIEDYMAKAAKDYQHATDLWTYFQNVINWAKTLFPKYRKEMKGVEWGILYNRFGTQSFNPQELEKQVSALMQDEEVTKPSGIYAYLLSGEERHLSLRGFDDKTKGRCYERQDGICVKCQQKFELAEMEADHITPWSKGGKTVLENCQMLCKACNRIKSDK